MSELSGALADFSLREVLRLVAEGSRSGILVVSHGDLRGSAFFQSGLLTYATTRSGPAVLEAGQPDRRVHTEGSEAEAAGIVSVIARLLRLHDGTFVFQRGIEPVHPTIVQLDITEVIDLAEVENARWDTILDHIGSIHSRFTLRPTHDREDVALTQRQWNVLASLALGHSVAEVAALTGHSDQDVAESVAEIAQAKLITPVSIDEEPASAEPIPAAAAPSPTRPAGPAPDPGGLVERYEYYVNSRGAELREPSPEELGIVLDLTAEAVDTPVEAVVAPATEPAPSSELARRWRSLRRGELQDEDE